MKLFFKREKLEKELNKSLLIVGLIGLLLFIFIKIPFVKNLIMKLVNPIFEKYANEELEPISKTATISKSIEENLETKDIGYKL